MIRFADIPVVKPAKASAKTREMTPAPAATPDASKPAKAPRKPKKPA